jgi:NADPH:quinone reductase-like Zn-dependent oxidoreductase
VETGLSWEDLAALPESYATAWTALVGIMGAKKGQTVVVRGATSALGQAAINIAAGAGAYVIATTRKRERLVKLESLGAKRAELESPALSKRIRELHPEGIDAVLELVGNSTLLDSLQAVRPRGRVCLAGFLGGGDPIAAFNPLTQMPSGVHLSFFGSAFVTGSPQYPLSDIPFQTIVERAAAGVYQAKPARVFGFDELPEAHRLMESSRANGKIVVRL